MKHLLILDHNKDNKFEIDLEVFIKTSKYRNNLVIFKPSDMSNNYESCEYIDYVVIKKDLSISNYDNIPLQLNKYYSKERFVYTDLDVLIYDDSIYDTLEQIDLKYCCLSIYNFKDISKNLEASIFPKLFKRYLSKEFELENSELFTYVNTWLISCNSDHEFLSLYLNYTNRINSIFLNNNKKSYRRYAEELAASIIVQQNPSIYKNIIIEPGISFRERDLDDEFLYYGDSIKNAIIFHYQDLNPSDLNNLKLLKKLKPVLKLIE